MWTKQSIFFTCLNSSAFTWVIVIAYLRHVERFFSVRFWQKLKRDKIRKLEYKLEESKKKLRLRWLLHLILTALTEEKIREYFPCGI